MSKKTKTIDFFLKSLILFFAFISIGFLIWIIGFILIKGLPQINLEFLTTKYYSDSKGIFPMIINTIYMVLLTLLISVPIGIFSAIYLIEYAKDGIVVKIIRFATETLSGIPSIVYGLFGLVFFVTILDFSWSLLSGCLTLSIVVLPTIIRTTEETLKTVPKEYREASLALGATKLITIYKVVIPSAIPGILTSIILSIGRIIGETAALIFTSGMVPKVAESIMNSGRTLSLHLYNLTKEGISIDQAYGTACVLLIIVFLINITANSIAKILKMKNLGDNNE